VKAAPPGWEPHRIVTRVDGWFVDPHDEGRIPAAIAQIMARTMPQPSVIELVRARMIARMVERGLSYE
jgi:hypothetical protein